MSVKFEHRPYSGRNFRPRPEVHIEPEAQLIVVATPWGPRSAAKKVIDRMLDYYLAAREDKEATSPFERLSCLSDAANVLRIAAMLANEALFREENISEYRAGVELFAASFDGQELVWLQSGNPQVLLSRPTRSIVPMGGNIDLSLDLTESRELMPALPSQMLGLDNTVNLAVQGLRTQTGDKLILLSHSAVPETVYSTPRTEISAEGLTRRIAKAEPDLAFWVGILEVENDAA